MITKRVSGRRWGRRAGRRIDERNGIVDFVCVLDIGVVRSKGLRVVLLLLTLGLLLFVQLALVLLVFRYAGLQGIGQLSLW